MVYAFGGLGLYRVGRLQLVVGGEEERPVIVEVSEVREPYLTGGNIFHVPLTWGFPKNTGTLFWGSYNKDPTI